MRNSTMFKRLLFQVHEWIYLETSHLCMYLVYISRYNYPYYCGSLAAHYYCFLRFFESNIETVMSEQCSNADSALSVTLEVKQ